jgi:hypothetical protein
MSDQVRRERLERYERLASGQVAPDIPPALTASEWAKQEEGDLGGFRIVGRGIDGPHYLAVLIARANAALPDEDPRKIRREHVRLLRDAADALPEEGRATALGLDTNASRLHEFADALESYLPPVPAIDRHPFRNDPLALGFPPLPSVD